MCACLCACVPPSFTFTQLQLHWHPEALCMWGWSALLMSISKRTSHLLDLLFWLNVGSIQQPLGHMHVSTALQEAAGSFSCVCVSFYLFALHLYSETVCLTQSKQNSDICWSWFRKHLDSYWCMIKQFNPMLHCLVFLHWSHLDHKSPHTQTVI